MTTSSAASDIDKALEALSHYYDEPNIGGLPLGLAKVIAQLMAAERESLPESVYSALRLGKSNAETLAMQTHNRMAASDCEDIMKAIGDLEAWQRGTAIEGDE